MAEYHTKRTPVSAVSYAEIMHQLHSAISNSSQTVLRFVTENSNTGVYVDTEPDGDLEFGTPAATSSWITNSYMVVEPVSAYPGTGRWQLKIKLTSTTEITLELAPDAGWSSATGNFTTNTTGALTMTPDVSGATWLTTPATLSQIYISAGQDTYNSTDTSSYLRVLFRHGSNNCATGFYCGGYSPLAATVDTKPVALLIGKPTAADDTKGWGRNDGNTATNFNRTPPDDAHSGSPATSTCYIRQLADFTSGTGSNLDRGGNAASPSVYLFTTVGNCLGIFGSGAFRGFDNATADWTASTSGGYVVTGDLLHRFTAS
jgi:hypothetical protein